MLFGVVVLVIALYFSVQDFVQDRESSLSGKSLYFNDTRVLPFSHLLCQRVTLSVESSSLPYTASVNVLKSPPTLLRQPDLNFEVQPQSREGYVNYKFHFYRGSNVDASACRLSGASTSDATFYMLKGDKEFEDLIKSKSSNSENKFEVSEDCQEDNTVHNFTADSEDFYHLVFFSPANVLKGINASFTIGQVQYSIDEENVLSRCSITSEAQSCSANVPVQATTTILSSAWSNYNGTVYKNKLKSSCSPRPWMIFVVSLSSALGIIILVVVMASILYLCTACRRSRPARTEPEVPGDKTPLVRDQPQDKMIN